MKILIMGATGNAGSQAIKVLQEKGIRPTAAVRDIAKAKEKLGEDLDYVHFDYFESSTYGPALEGVDRMFFIAPPPSKDPQVVAEITEVAREKGVSLMVFQSGRSTGSIPGKPLNTIENNLKSSGMNVCVIRPAWYMQNFHTWMGPFLDEDSLTMNTGDAKISFIDLKDLGAGIAEILSGEGHAGKHYTLTGFEAVDHGTVASILTETTGRNIVYNDVSDAEFIEKIQAKGWNEKAAKYTAWLFDQVKGGVESEVSTELEEILGRKPRSFKEFALDEFGK